MKKTILTSSLFLLLLSAMGQIPLIATSKYTFLTGEAKLTDSAQYFIETTRYTTPYINSSIALNFDSSIIYTDGGQAGISISSKLERNYNSNNKILEDAKYKIGGNGWVKDTRQLFTYDQYDNKAIIVNQFGYLNDWNNNNKLSQVFDNLGRVITTSNYDGLGYAWTFHDSTVYTYSAVGPPSASLSFTLINNNIIANKRSGFTSSNTKLYETYNFQANVWDKNSRVTFFADSALYENYSTNKGWFYTAATATKMGNSKPLSEREYYYNGANFVFSKRSTYSFHNNDEKYLLYYLYENPLPSVETLFTYDNNNIVIQKDQSSYTNGSYVNTLRTVNYYSNNLLSKQFILNINIKTLVTDSISKADYTYENGQLQQEEYKKYNKQTNSFEYIGDAYIQKFYYKNIVTNSLNKIKENNCIQLFPNPSSGVFYVSNIQQITKLRAFDLWGKEIDILQESNNAFYVKNKGLILLHIYSENGLINTKQLLVE